MPCKLKRLNVNFKKKKSLQQIMYNNPVCLLLLLVHWNTQCHHQRHSNSKPENSSESHQIASLHHLFLATVRHAGSKFPNQGSNTCPLQWRRRVSTTGPPGKSLNPPSKDALNLTCKNLTINCPLASKTEFTIYSNH